MYILDNVSKKYISKNRQIYALFDLSLNLPNTGMIFIVGKSGSGKSTLLNLLSGVIKPSEGLVKYDGQEISSMATSKALEFRKNTISYIFQDDNLLTNISIMNNVLLPELFVNNDRNTESKMKMLSRLGIETLVNEKPNNVSGGQRQRVAIARALVKKSPVILADEPTGSLDSETSIQIMEVLKDISKEVLIIVVSHDERLAKQFADRIIRLDNGKIVDDTVLADLDYIDHELDNNIKPNKSIPYFKALWLNFVNSKTHYSKLIFTSVLLLIAFLLTLVTLSLNDFSIDRALNEAMLKEEIKYGSLTKKIGSDNFFEYDYFDDEEYQYLKTNLDSNLNFIYSDAYVSSSLFFINDVLIEGDNYVSGMTTFTNSDLEKYNLNMIVGQLPDNPTEIAITEFTAAFLNINSTNYQHIDVKIGERDYLISGIVDSRYHDVTEEYGNLSESIQIRFSYVNAVFLTPDEITYHQAYFDEFFPDAEAGYISLLTTKSYSTSIEALNHFDSHVYQYQNYLTPSTLQVSSFIYSLKDFTLWTSLIFVILTFIVLFNHVVSDLQLNIRDIKILYSIGSSTTDIFKIYVNKHLLLIFITYLIASAGLYIGVHFLNLYFISALSLSISIIFINPLIVILLFAISLFFMISLIYYLIYRFSKERLYTFTE